jgi:hypothetical protein
MLRAARGAAFLAGGIWAAAITARVAAAQPPPPLTLRQESIVRTCRSDGALFQLVHAVLAMPNGRTAVLGLANDERRLCVLAQSGAIEWSVPFRRDETPLSIAASGDTIAVMVHRSESDRIFLFVVGRPNPLREVAWQGELRDQHALIGSTGGPFFVLTTNTPPGEGPRYTVRTLVSGPAAKPVVEVADPAPRVVVAGGRGGDLVIAAPWTARVSFAAAGGRVLSYIGQGHSIEVVAKDGVRASPIPVPGKPVPFTDSLREELLRAWRASAGRGAPDSAERLLRMTEKPTARPAVRSILVNAGGDIAVVRNDVGRAQAGGTDSSHVDIIRRTGETAGRLVLTPGQIIRAFGDGVILVVIADSTRMVRRPDRGDSAPSFYVARFAVASGGGR